MTTYQTIADQIIFTTGQDTLSTADLLRIINFSLDWYSDIALQSDGRWKFDPHTVTDSPIATTNLVTNQQKYILDTNFLKIDRIEAYLQGEWRVLEQIDRREYKDTPLSTVFSTNDDPKFYDYDGNAIYLYPTPDESVTSGLKVFFSRPVAYVTALSETIGIPRIHAEAIATHGASQVAMRTNDKNRVILQNQVMSWEPRIKDYFSSRDEDRPRRLKPKLHNTFTGRFNTRH